MDNLDKNGQFGQFRQKWTIWTKMDNLDKNEQFGQIWTK